jgi:hypothetical protein
MRVTSSRLGVQLFKNSTKGVLQFEYEILQQAPVFKSWTPTTGTILGGSETFGMNASYLEELVPGVMLLKVVACPWSFPSASLCCSATMKLAALLHCAPSAMNSASPQFHSDGA